MKKKLLTFGIIFNNIFQMATILENLPVQDVYFNSQTVNRIITPARCLVYGPR